MRLRGFAIRCIRPAWIAFSESRVYRIRSWHTVHTVTSFCFVRDVDGNTPAAVRCRVMLAAAADVERREIDVHLILHHAPGFKDVVSLDFPRCLADLPAGIRTELQSDNAASEATAATPPPPPPPSPTLPRARRRRIVHTSASDEELERLALRFNHRWRAMARHMGGRARGWTDDICRNRYLRICVQHGRSYLPRRKTASRGPYETSASAPSQAHGGVRNGWVAEEDAQLVRGVSLHGTRWKQIVRCLPGRSVNSCRNRATRLGLVGPS